MLLAKVIVNTRQPLVRIDICIGGLLLRVPIAGPRRRAAYRNKFQKVLRDRIEKVRADHVLHAIARDIRP